MSLMDTFRREVNFEKEQVFSFIPAMIAQVRASESEKILMCLFLKISLQVKK